MKRYPDPQLSRVALAGTSDYEHDNKLHRLPAVRNNLVDLAEAFINPKTGAFASENCTVIDTPDSPKSLMQRLSRSAREAEDVFIAYYAGHGILGLGTKLYLSVRETDPQQLDGTAVPFEWVRDAIRMSPAKIRMLILDCCFSGRAIGAMSSDSAALEQIQITGTTILTSTTANDISHSMPGERYTAFTAELITLLTKTSDDVLTIGDLYLPLSAAMARRGLPSPKASIGDSSGSIILRRPSMPRRTVVSRINSNPDLNTVKTPSPPPALAFDAPPIPQTPNPYLNRATSLPAPTQLREPFPVSGPKRAPTKTLISSISGLNWHSNSPFVTWRRLEELAKRAGPLSAIIVLSMSTLLSGSTFVAGINEIAHGNYTRGAEGVAAVVITFIIVCVWLLSSAYLLLRILKWVVRRRSQRPSKVRKSRKRWRSTT